MQTLTPAQERAVRWYIGDVEGDDPFWGDDKAYVTINSLFFPGCSTEYQRNAEGKHLNPALVSDEARLLAVLRDLLSAFQPLEQPVETYRVERYVDYALLKEAAQTVSFTSTSTAGFLRAYQDRWGIALMRFSLRAGTPCIPMAQALPHYAKADEAEILLPPGLQLSFRELPLTPEELTIRDAKGNPVLVSAHCTACGDCIPCPEAPPLPGGNEAAVRFFRSLAQGEPENYQNEIQYARWKAGFVRMVTES